MNEAAEPAADQLPPPRRPGTPYRVALVCLGNICRSPMAEVVLSDRLEQAGLDGRVEVTSAGTGSWHVGKPMDGRAAAALAARGYDGSRHRARRFEAAQLGEVDLVLAMDGLNHADLTSLAPTREELGRLRLFRDFDPAADGTERDVPDPYYGGDDGFREVLELVERTADRLAATLARTIGAG